VLGFESKIFAVGAIARVHDCSDVETTAPHLSACSP
jgi:hypothetical protein